MKVLKYLIAVFCFVMVLSFHESSFAQCSMCTMNAENSVQNGNTQGKGLNDGILYLLAAPYLAVAAVGFLWYKKYRKKNIDLNVPDSKINLN